jgi:hypothetical protein
MTVLNVKFNVRVVKIMRKIVQNVQRDLEGPWFSPNVVANKDTFHKRVSKTVKNVCPNV